MGYLDDMASTRRDLSQLESDVQLLTSRTSEAVSKCSTRRQVKQLASEAALDARTKEYDDRREKACDFASQRTPRPEKGFMVGRLINNELLNSGAAGFKTVNSSLIGNYTPRASEDLIESKKHMRKFVSGPPDCFSHYQDKANKLNVDLRASNHDCDLAFNSLAIASKRE